MKRFICFILIICVLFCMGGISAPSRPRYVPEDLYSDLSELAAALSGGNIKAERKQIDPSLPMIALTFDDGPTDGVTDAILDILEKHGVVATFFVVGGKVKRGSETLQRAFEMGNEIANHTMNHRYLTTLSKENIALQITQANDAIEEVTGQPPAFLRVPFGATNDNVAEVAAELGMPVMLWSIDPSDYLDVTTDYINEHILSRVRDGSVILLHDTRLNTANAVEQLIPALLDEGYQFVTVSELFYYNDLEFESGVHYGFRQISALFNKRLPSKVVG